MRVADDEVTWIGDFVHITRNGARVASGRWREGRIIEGSGNLDLRDDAAAWQALEEALRAESDAFVASSADAAYDARGVDLTQIRRMLSLFPAERLEVLDGERRSIAHLLENATGN